VVSLSDLMSANCSRVNRHPACAANAAEKPSVLRVNSELPIEDQVYVLCTAVVAHVVENHSYRDVIVTPTVEVIV